MLKSSPVDSNYNIIIVVYSHLCIIGIYTYVYYRALYTVIYIIIIYMDLYTYVYIQLSIYYRGLYSISHKKVKVPYALVRLRYLRGTLEVRLRYA